MKESFLFNTISGIYSLFYNHQIKMYEKAVAAASPQFDVTQYKNALDVGCGTGALCAVFHEHGVNMTGVDIAKKMIDVAKRKNSGKEIAFSHIDKDKNLPFDNNSFDFVIASYVSHGLTQDKRTEFLKEMKRVAKHHVILHEFSQKRRLRTDIIEWLEGGNYFQFLKGIDKQLIALFGNYKLIEITEDSVWYIMKT